MKTPPPILASEVLCEDLAPLEPGRSASRFWDLGFAGLYLAIAAALHFGFGPAAAEPNAGAVCLAAAAASCVTAIAPFPYLWRATVGGFIGAALVLLGLGSVGPLALLANPGSTFGVETSRTIAFVILPAILLFRSHYRAFAKRRVLLAIALLASLPFLVNEVLVLFGGPFMMRLGATIALTAVLSALGAVASTPTNTVSAWAAQALVAAAALEIGLRDAYLPSPPHAGPFAYTVTGASFFAALVPMALGLFQVLASIYAPRARIAAGRRMHSHDDMPPSAE
ncbi:MAG TPA: hypothetical protein VGL13_16170 [Polyangiaceae bacterium]|jgi:hypothetical protein